MAASFKRKFATLSNINTSSGKAVFSGTLEKTDAAGMHGFSWVMGGSGYHDFPKREGGKK